MKMSQDPIRFNRQEWAGAFGDIGTDFPLIVGMILAAGLNPASVLTMFGLMQVMTGLIYRRPMAVQPLKAVAALVIAQKISGNIIYGAGLSIAIFMLLLMLSGAINWLARVIPKEVIRGIQFGLGIKLGMVALGRYIVADGIEGYILAIIAFITVIFLLNNRRYPAALIIIGLGLIYAFIFKINLSSIQEGVGVHLPKMYFPTSSDIFTGFVLLAIPQIPLSIGNSILATKQLSEDLFPEKPISIQKIGLTYSLMNFINPFFGGIPTCHGSGGMAGHYAFGGRTGGSIIIYGMMYIILGLFFSGGMTEIIHFFPLPILGVILFFESLALMVLIRDLVASRSQLFIALLVGLIAGGLPYGFVVGMVVGIFVAYLFKRWPSLERFTAGGRP